MNSREPRPGSPGAVMPTRGIRAYESGAGGAGAARVAGHCDQGRRVRLRRWKATRSLEQ